MPDRKNFRTSSLPVLKRVLRYVRRYLPILALSLLLALVTVALNLYVPILAGRGIDLIIGPGQVDLTGLGRVLVSILLCILASSLCQWAMNMINNRVTYHTVRDVRGEAFRHLQELPLRYLDGHPAGDTVSRMIADVDTFADGLLMGFTQFFTGILTILGTLIFMLRLSPPTAAAVVLLTPLSLLAARFIARRTYSMFRLQSATRGEQTAMINEVIAGQKLVHAFGREEAVMADFDEVNTRLRDCSLKATFYSSMTNPTTRFVNSLVYAAVALLGGLTVLTGGLTVGGLTSFLSYANQYTKPFNEISGVVTELQNALACAGRIFELIDSPARVPDPEAPRDPECPLGSVAVRHVDFAYTPEKPLITDFSLTVEPGQRVAIVGPTGCGKTTMINLLMRFYDPDAGTISLDGTDTRSMTRHGLRRQIGMVLQDTWLCAGTIRDNIAMGKPDATDEEVIAAAKAARAHSFIRRLPEGYDTRVTENGGQLSQGQKQLLCVARVMLCHPPMLILDEATSSIDIRTEQKVQTAFAEMMRGRTSFIVAHRLSTIREADIILVMKDGSVVEQGTHDSLLAKNGFYASLYRSQFDR